MLQVIHTVGLPISITLDPTAEFEPGMIAQLKLIGNDIVAGVSDGTAPYGIIDDIKTKSFSRAQIDEVIEIRDVDTEIDSNGIRVSLSETHQNLENPSILESSFIATVDVHLNPINGIVYVPAGTPVNYDYDDDGINDGFRIISNYAYYVANQPGEDSTFGSGKVTIHYHRGVYATDQFDPRQNYPLNCALYVGLNGKLTSKAPTQHHPSVAFCSGPPSSVSATIEFVFL